MSYLALADQRILLLWKKILKYENTVLRTLAIYTLNKCAVNLILSKYALNSIFSISTSSIKNGTWNHFVD